MTNKERLIDTWLTPNSVLSDCENLPDAVKILPDVISSFADLCAKRDEIKHLRLLPVKQSKDREFYRSFDKQELLRDLLIQIGDNKFLLAENRFPYFLPPGIRQYLIWVKDPNETREEVVKEIARCLEQLNCSVEHSIFFERPLNCTKMLVRGTFPQLRHIHLWINECR